MLHRSLAPAASMGAALVLALSACVLSSTPPSALEAHNGDGVTALQQPSGKAIFEGKGNCATCHGRAGKGTSLGPDLTDGEWLTGTGSLADITAVVRSGVPRPKRYPAPMPPMGGARLQPAEIDAVSRYVLTLGGAGQR